MEQPSKRFQVLVISFMVVGLVVHAVAFLMFSVDINPRVRPRGDSAYVDFLAAGKEIQDSSLLDALELFDTEPLLLPHPMNYGGELDLSTQRWEPEPALLEAFPPVIVLNDEGLEGLDDENRQVPEVVDLLRGFGRDYWSSFGEVVMAGEERLAEQEIWLSARRMGDGKELMFSLPDIAFPGGEMPMQPARFLLYLGDRDGFGEPFLVKGCGSERFDLFFRDLIIQELPGRLLGYNGYFEVVVGL